MKPKSLMYAYILSGLTIFGGYTYIGIAQDRKPTTKNMGRIYEINEQITDYSSSLEGITLSHKNQIFNLISERESLESLPTISREREEFYKERRHHVYFGVTLAGLGLLGFIVCATKMIKQMDKWERERKDKLV